MGRRRNPPPPPGRIPRELLPPHADKVDWSAAIPLIEGVHGTSLEPNGRMSLIPTAAEVSALPRDAQRALAARYLDQLALVGPTGSPPPDGPPAAVVEWAALEMVRRAMHRTPVGHYLYLLRYDYVKLARRAKAENWTDDTTVPADTFDPLGKRG